MRLQALQHFNVLFFMDSIDVVKERETSPLFMMQLVLSDEAVGRLLGKEGFVYHIINGVRAVGGPGEGRPLCTPVNRPNQQRQLHQKLIAPASRHIMECTRSSECTACMPSIAPRATNSMHLKQVQEPLTTCISNRSKSH